MKVEKDAWIANERDELTSRPPYLLAGPWAPWSGAKGTRTGRAAMRRWRARLAAAAWVAGFLGAVRVLAPTPELQAEWQYRIALPLGYGHLLGGLLFGRRRLAALVPEGVPPGLFALFVANGACLLLVLYVWSLGQALLYPFVLVGMLVVSAWHIAENDVAVADARQAGLALAPLRGGLRELARCSLFLLGIGVLALATPAGHAYQLRYVGLLVIPFQLATVADVGTAILLYHAATWVLFTLERARALAWSAPREARRMRRALFWVHAAPLALALGAHLWLEGLYVYVSAPFLYLFWSVLHALQTAATRNTRSAAPTAG